MPEKKLASDSLSDMPQRHSSTALLMCAGIKAGAGGMFHNMFYTAQTLERHGVSCELMLNSGIAGRLHPVLGWAILPYVITAKILLRLVRGEKIAFVQIHEPAAYFYCLLTRCIPLLPPAIVRSHGVEEYFAAVTEKNEPFSARYKLFLALRLRLNRLAFRLARLIVVNDEADRLYLRQRMEVTNCVLSRIALERDIFAGVKHREHEGVKAVFIGSWVTRKGRHLMRSIVPQALERCPQLSFLLLGTGPQAAADFSAVVQEYGGRLEIIPHFDGHRELAQYLSAADILLCPSLIESGPQAVLEGMAFGLAVVCSDTCMLIRDIAGSGEVRFVEAGNAQGFVNALIALAQDPEERQLLAARGRAFMEHYTWDAAVREYADWLKQELAARRFGALHSRQD